MKRIACLAVLLTALLFAHQPASAYWPYFGFGGGYGGWGNIQTTNYVPAPPYYAVHPPVYYSPHITARHYGASPYAWLPGMQPITYVPETVIMPRPGVAVAEENLKPQADGKVAAVVIENPFFQSKTVAGEGANEVRPVSVENPHFASVAR